MVENNAKGSEVRRYFILMEKLALESTIIQSDLYRAVTAKQCQFLNDASGALLGDVAQWTQKN